MAHVSSKKILKNLLLDLNGTNALYPIFLMLVDNILEDGISVSVSIPIYDAIVPIESLIRKHNIKYQIRFKTGLGHVKTHFCTYFSSFQTNQADDYNED